MALDDKDGQWHGLGPVTVHTTTHSMAPCVIACWAPATDMVRGSLRDGSDQGGDDSTD